MEDPDGDAVVVLGLNGARIRQPRRFGHGEAVHVRAEHDRGADAVAEHAHHACLADAASHLVSVALEPIRCDFRGADLVHRELGVLMQVLVDGFELWEQRVRLRSERRREGVGDAHVVAGHGLRWSGRCRREAAFVPFTRPGLRSAAGNKDATEQARPRERLCFVHGRLLPRATPHGFAEHRGRDREFDASTLVERAVMLGARCVRIHGRRARRRSLSRGSTRSWSPHRHLEGMLDERHRAHRS